LLTLFTTITNAFISLGKPIDTDQKVRKINRALSQAWEINTLKEFNDKEEMNFTAFMKNLKTYEIEMKARKDRKPQKEDGIALKASSKELKKKSVVNPTTSEDDEELTLLVKT